MCLTLIIIFISILSLINLITINEGIYSNYKVKFIITLSIIIAGSIIKLCTMYKKSMALEMFSGCFIFLFTVYTIITLCFYDFSIINDSKKVYVDTIEYNTINFSNDADDKSVIVGIADKKDILDLTNCSSITYQKLKDKKYIERYLVKEEYENIFEQIAEKRYYTFKIFTCDEDEYEKIQKICSKK